MSLPHPTSLREHLLPRVGGSGHSAVPGQLVCTEEPQVKIFEGRNRDYVISALLLLAIALPSITVTVVVATQWSSNPSQRGWLVLGFGFYIVSWLGLGWSRLMKLCVEMFYLRIEVRRFAAPILFDAITNAVSSEAEKSGRTCSFDQEAVQEHDGLTDTISVKLKFWSSQTRTVNVAIGKQSEHPEHSRQQLHAQVQFQPGDDVVIGRDSRLERRELLVIWARTRPSRVRADKQILTEWMEASYKAFVKPTKNVVEIYALQESSSDWVPEWRIERRKPVKDVGSRGHGFFLARDSLNKVLADAKLWPSQTLRIYIITGPPGVGKSEFTLWMAAQLGLPIYRLSLTSRQLTDERLAQLLSPSSVKFSSVMVQVDEFQEILARWDAKQSTGVSPGGFCEVLQGSTAMGQGVVILTGTSEIVSQKMKDKFPAVYRRILNEGELSWMSQANIGDYFRNFLEDFVPKLDNDKWNEKTVQFMSCPCWSGGQNVSIDILKQFLMNQITESNFRGLGHFVDGGAGSDVPVFQVSPANLDAFFDLVCDSVSANDFLRRYAPVHVSMLKPAKESGSK